MSGKVRRKNKVEEENTKELSKWAKMTKPGADWTKDEILDVVYVLRQILGVLLGIIWGIIPLLGSAGLLSYVAVSVIVLLVYYTRFLGIDDEALTGRMALIQEGFMPGFSLFIISWIISYNFIYISA